MQLTVQQAARFLEVTERQIHAWIDGDEIPFSREQGRVRFNQAELLEWATARGLRGSQARPSKAPAKPLELYSFESSPYSRLVRERLCELEIPYLLRNMAKARWEDVGPPWIRAKYFPDLPVEGRNRLRLLGLAGKVQVPYLIDPNTGVSMFESAAILRYLDQTYAA